MLIFFLFDANLMSKLAYRGQSAVYDDLHQVVRKLSICCRNISWIFCLFLSHFHSYFKTSEFY